MNVKRRLSVSVDAALLSAAEAAVKRRDVPTLSAWVSDALRLKLDRDTKLRGLAEVMADFEREFGPITDADREAAVREARRRAISVRGLRASESKRKYGK